MQLYINRLCGMLVYMLALPVICFATLELPTVLGLGFAVATPSEAWQLPPQSIFSGCRL